MLPTSPWWSHHNRCVLCLDPTPRISYFCSVECINAFWRGEIGEFRAAINDLDHPPDYQAWWTRATNVRRGLWGGTGAFPPGSP